LKVVAVVLAVAVVIVLWFAEQIGDFRRRLTQGFAILKDRPAYLRRVAFWQGIDWTLRLVGGLFFLHAFGLPVTVHNALLVQVSAGLASLLPITPSGIGTEQAFLLYLLRDQASGRRCSRSASACGSRSSSSTSRSASRRSSSRCGR
jgi:Predicted integral membrane protein